jgi:hypothetical protein
MTTRGPNAPNAPNAPKTLSFSTPTVRNQRTLVWLQQQSASVPWWKWDGAVDSLDAYHRWTAQGAHVVGLVLCGCTDEVCLDEVYRVAQKVQFVLLPRNVIQTKPEDYWQENFDNVFVIDDLHEMYPFVGDAWDGTVADAMLLLGLVGRYHRVVDVLSPAPAGFAESKRPTGEMAVEQGIRPAELVWFTQFYLSKDKKRTQELRECLRRNLKSRWIDRVVLLNERDESVAWASFAPRDVAKIEQRVIGRRLTYLDFFQEVSRRWPAGSGLDAVVALGNADIYVGEEMAEVWRIRWEDRAICLLRWDDHGEGAGKARLFGPRADSQDVWMFSAASVATRRWKEQEVGIPLGKPGCDNAILRPLLQQRFLLSNPALSLKTYHLHGSGIRTYTKADAVYSPVYIHLEPTYLIDTKQEYTPRGSPQHLCNETVPFTVRSSSMSNEITYCTMLEKAGRYRWEPMVENYYFEPAIPVYTWQGGAGVTPNGLVYDLYRIYTGRAAIHQPEYNYWPVAGVDLFTPLRSASRMVAIPLANAERIFQDKEVYLLFYGSRYLRLRSLSPDQPLSGWAPSDMGEWMDKEGWIGAERWVADAIPWEGGTACWAKEVVGFLPGPSMAELGREDVDVLRRHRRNWMAVPSVLEGKRRCVVVGDNVLTAEWVTGVRDVLGAGWMVERVRMDQVDALYGASLCLLVGGPNTEATWAPIWRLPKGAVLLEFQQELAVGGECQHVAHVADLASWVFLLAKGSNEDVQADVLAEVKGWWGKHQGMFS